MADPTKPKMVRAAVAPRHTVMVGLPARTHGPGTLVDLPEDEAARLMRAGFLLDPQAPEIEVGMGPNYQGPTDGVLRPA